MWKAIPTTDVMLMQRIFQVIWRNLNVALIVFNLRTIVVFLSAGNYEVKQKKLAYLKHIHKLDLGQFQIMAFSNTILKFVLYTESFLFSKNGILYTRISK